MVCLQTNNISTLKMFNSNSMITMYFSVIIFKTYQQVQCIKCKKIQYKKSKCNTCKTAHSFDHMLHKILNIKTDT